MVAVNLVVCFFQFGDYVLDFLEFPAAKIISLNFYNLCPCFCARNAVVSCILS